MVVDDFDIACVAIFEHETNPKLIVDTNTMFPFSIAGQRLKTVSRRNIQLGKATRAMQNAKFLQRRSVNLGGNSSAPAGVPQLLRLGVREALDHIAIITQRVKNAKRY